MTMTTTTTTRLYVFCREKPANAPPAFFRTNNKRAARNKRRRPAVAAAPAPLARGAPAAVEQRGVLAWTRFAERAQGGRTTAALAAAALPAEAPNKKKTSEQIGAVRGVSAQIRGAALVAVAKRGIGMARPRAGGDRRQTWQIPARPRRPRAASPSPGPPPPLSAAGQARRGRARGCAA